MRRPRHAATQVIELAANDVGHRLLWVRSPRGRRLVLARPGEVLQEER